MSAASTARSVPPPPGVACRARDPLDQWSLQLRQRRAQPERFGRQRRETAEEEKDRTKLESATVGMRRAASAGETIDLRLR